MSLFPEIPNQYQIIMQLCRNTWVTFFISYVVLQKMSKAQSSKKKDQSQFRRQKKDAQTTIFDL